MKTLSVRPPWAQAIIFAGKDVENRRWWTQYRGPLLIHASRKIDEDAMIGFELTACRKVLNKMNKSGMQTGGIIGKVYLVDIVENYPSPWAEPGMKHWILANAEPLPFYPCRGELGLFEVDYPF